VELTDGVAALSWTDASGRRTGRLSLPRDLSWTQHRGETSPILGWYSPRFGERVPSTSLVGAGAWTGRIRLTTVLQLSDTSVAVGSPGAREWEVAR
jgi:hypothetical protein